MQKHASSWTAPRGKSCITIMSHSTRRFRAEFPVLPARFRRRRLHRPRPSRRNKRDCTQTGIGWAIPVHKFDIRCANLAYTCPEVGFSGADFIGDFRLVRGLLKEMRD